MKRVVCLLLCAVMLLSLLPAAVLAAEPGEPVLLPGVRLKEDNSQLYLGIGRFLYDDVELAGNSSFTAPGTETHWETFSVILWKKVDEGYSRVGVEHYNSTEIEGWDQLSGIALSTPSRVDDGTNAPLWNSFIDEYNWTDYNFGFDSTTTGTWEITASCMLNGAEYKVSCYITQKTAVGTEINADEVDTLEKLNAKLAEIIQAESTQPQQYYIHLPAQTYAGTVVIPAEGTNSGRKIVYLCGSTADGDAETTIKGGIRSDNDLLVVQNIHFIGAGKDAAALTDDTTPNSALYGSGKADSFGCTFEGYDKAVVWEANRRMFGRANTYKNNNIAWYVNRCDGDASGDTQGVETTFESNNCAIYIESVGNLESTGRITDDIGNNVFCNNTTDIRNGSGHIWCIPGNFFTHTDTEGNVIPSIEIDADAASPVSCFPMYDRDSEQFYYEYEPAEAARIISNNLAGKYPIPQDKLTGKTFRIVDEDAEQMLATLTFDNTTSDGAPFIAAVRVERIGSTISFSINSIGRNVQVELPCAFKNGTVTLEGSDTALENAVFDGRNVSFTTGTGGVYTIEPAEDGGEQLQPGVPTPITVTIDGEEKTCWFGVGEFINGRYTVLHGSYMGKLSTENAVPSLAVGLWWKNSSDEFTMLSPEEAAQVQQQAHFQLEFQPLSAAPGDLPAKLPASEEELAAGMPEASRYLLKGRHAGTWRIVATCKINDKTYIACGEFERGIINRIDVTGCTTAAQINEALQNRLRALVSSGTQQSTTIRVVMEAPEYTGQIVVPDVPPSVKDIVDVEFVGSNPSEAVTLRGGISSISVGIWASNITFIGAGKDETNWPADGENAGTENAALYGNSHGSADSCVFIGYYYAMKMTEGVRLCGTNNVFQNNHIAWYVEGHNGNGGSPNAENCTFKENDIAIRIEKFSEVLPMSFYAPNRCVFLDNTLDIQLNSDDIGSRTWFIPGNYFAQTDETGAERRKTMISPAASVSFYPMRKGDQFYYDDAEWGAANGILLSNSLTSAYPTPQEYLAGKTFQVIDADNTTTLATFAFAGAEQQSVRGAARRTVQQESFDATVRVERTADRIVFAMNSPCRSVLVKLPCTFAGGAVTHNGQVVAGAKFDGKIVSFETSEGGTYVIHASPSTCVIAAGYNICGQLVGVQFLSGADAYANIPDAVTIRIFTLDSSYRPIAQVTTRK